MTIINNDINDGETIKTRLSNGISLARIFAMLWIFSINLLPFAFGMYYDKPYEYALENNGNFIELANSNTWWADRAYFFFAFSGWTGVILFVFLSGFSMWLSILSSRKFDLKSFFLKRFNSVYVPYFFAAMAAFFVVVVFLRRMPGDYDFVSLLMGASKLVPRVQAYNSPLWFITLIFSCYLLFPIIPALYSKFRFKGIMLVFATSSAVWLYAWGGSHYLAQAFKVSMYPIVPFFVIMCLGVIAAHSIHNYFGSDFRKKFKKYENNFIKTAIVFYSIFLYVFFGEISFDPEDQWAANNWIFYGKYILTPIAGIMVLAIGYFLPLRCYSLIRRLSRGTFAFFLYHYLIILFVFSYLKLNIVGYHISADFIVLYLIMLVGFSIFQSFFDKIIGKKIKKLSEKEYIIN
ncbi:MAG: hypothetical protein YFSK_0900 [Candidatus Yanofskyibacterium parasiticum]|jgi:peptidoglycan/LPS O-acetylase OafA/YrhL|nr:MAG: hypothetical protein YFSK_0900 [Candidatus Yanofskybacteria bacterium]